MLKLGKFFSEFLKTIVFLKKCCRWRNALASMGEMEWLTLVHFKFLVIVTRFNFIEILWQEIYFN